LLVSWVSVGTWQAMASLVGVERKGTACGGTIGRCADRRTDDLQFRADSPTVCLRLRVRTYGRPISDWTARELADEGVKQGIVETSLLGMWDD